MQMHVNKKIIYVSMMPISTEHSYSLYILLKLLKKTLLLYVAIISLDPVF